jgi:hypothetical protein
MPKAIHFPYPPRWINEYIKAAFVRPDGTLVYDDIDFGAIVPVTQADTQALWENILDSSATDHPIIIDYERLMRFRPNSFYPVKREQLMYSMRSTSLVNLNNVEIIISQLLDREDAAAQDINAWAAAKQQSEYPLMDEDGDVLPYNVYFHNVKVYKFDESRDVQELAVMNKASVGKLIIEYDYHVSWNQDMSEENAESPFYFPSAQDFR